MIAQAEAGFKPIAKKCGRMAASKLNPYNADRSDALPFRSRRWWHSSSRIKNEENEMNLNPLATAALYLSTKPFWMTT